MAGVLVDDGSHVTGAVTVRNTVSFDRLWKVVFCSVSVGPAPGASIIVNQPMATVSKVVSGTINFIEGSFTGAADSSDSRYFLEAGNVIQVAWTGGDIGATANVTFQIWKGDSKSQLAPY